MTALLLAPAIDGGAEDAGGDSAAIRVATFNVSLYRDRAGQLVRDLEGGDAQAAVIAEIIRHVRPDILLLNEFDYDAEGEAIQLFLTEYLGVGHGDEAPVDYPHVYIAPVNTGVASGHDLNNDGRLGEPADCFGYGTFEGQYGMAVLSIYPIVLDEVRTFRTFLWRDMPGALLPTDPTSGAPWYAHEELEILRLSSKSHWDLPIRIGDRILHVLASHPTPPVFDGAEDANGRSNHDQIRLWGDYIRPDAGEYIYDDNGRVGGLDEEALFVILGDLNADPHDGDSVSGAIAQLLDSPWINSSIAPESAGGVEQADLQRGANLSHDGDPRYDTADWSDRSTGNLRVDYALPSAALTIRAAGVFWPDAADPLFRLVGIYPFPGSDHRLVWVDLRL